MNFQIYPKKFILILWKRFATVRICSNPFLKVGNTSKILNLYLFILYLYHLIWLFFEKKCKTLTVICFFFKLSLVGHLSYEEWLECLIGKPKRVPIQRHSVSFFVFNLNEHQKQCFRYNLYRVIWSGNSVKKSDGQCFLSFPNSGGQTLVGAFNKPGLQKLFLFHETSNWQILDL